MALLILSLVAIVFVFPFKSSAAPPLPTIRATAEQLQPIKAPISSSKTNVVELQSSEDGESFLAKGPGILMVYAPWCGHCKFMMPAYDDASTQTSVRFARLEGSKAGAFMQKHQIRGFPTIMIVDANNVVTRHMGGRDVASLLSAASQAADVPVSQPAPTAAVEAPSDSSPPAS